jgi:hypothetical protein
MSDESNEIRTMRAICWQRLIGEAEAIMTTYWGAVNPGFDEFSRAFAEFKDTVNDNGWVE